MSIYSNNATEFYGCHIIPIVTVYYLSFISKWRTKPGAEAIKTFGYLLGFCWDNLPTKIIFRGKRMMKSDRSTFVLEHIFCCYAKGKICKQHCSTAIQTIDLLQYLNLLLYYWNFDERELNMWKPSKNLLCWHI